MSEIKYEKIDNQNIRQWIKGDIIEKNILNQERVDLQGIISRSSKEKEIIKQKLKPIGLMNNDYDVPFQNRIVEIEYLINLYNSTVVNETISFVNNI